MSFPINPNIPAANHTPSSDQGPMQINFQSINSFLGIDHTAPGSSAAAGQHNQVRFTANESAPSLANAVCSLFANVGPSLSELWFSNGTKTWQMTDLQIISGSNSGTAGGTLFYIDTPWNMRFYYGKTNASISGGTVTYSTPYSTLFFAFATADDANAHYVSCQQNSTSTLTLKADATVSAIIWFALGRI